MAAVKIKISALAKDLGVDKNEMLELLQTFGSKAKSAQSSIESNELDIVFEHYTHPRGNNSLRSRRRLLRPFGE